MLCGRVDGFLYEAEFIVVDQKRMENGFANGKTNGTTYRTFEIEDVKLHSSVDDCWVTHQNNVYNVTNFLDTHPGGADLILSHAGSDITDVLNDENVHKHSACAYNLLEEYHIGKLRKNDGTDNNEVDTKNLCGFKEDIVDWNKGMVFQVHKFGEDYLKWVHSPVNKNLRLFDSDFVEFFSKTKWYVIPIVWIPIVVLCSVVSVGELTLTMRRFYDNDGSNFFALLSFLILFFAGVPIWTLMEYILHRYLFHLEPDGDSPMLITIHFFFHGQHHKVPFDKNRLVFPPVAAGCFAFAFWRLFNFCLPGGIGNSLMCGGILGYVGYDLIHYYMHHGSPRKGSYLHKLKHYHVLHHFNDPNTGFGISTRFWDFPFNTVNKKLL